MKSIYPVLNTHATPLQPGNTCALGIMVKAPMPGVVKTRLVPHLTAEEATALSICFIRDVAANVAEVSTAMGAAGVAVYTPAGTEQLFDGVLPDGFSLLLQRGEHLGERLFHATQDLLCVGYGSLCLINSDSPTLPQSILLAAVDALARDGDRLVLGIADDGGYYLIGLKRAHRRLFADIEWSTPRVAAQTLERARELGLEVELLPKWYDVDDPATLGRLCDELFSNRAAGANGAAPYPAPNSRAYVAGLIEARGQAVRRG